MARKKKKDIALPHVDPKSFITHHLYWDDPRLGNTSELDRRLGALRGGNIKEGLDKTAQRLTTSLSSGSLNEKGREKAQKHLRDVDKLRGAVRNRPTTIRNISTQFANVFNEGVDFAIERNIQIPGAEWYFEHRQAQSEAIAPEANLTVRQQTGMGAKLSSGKSPEDEIASLSGISRLVSTHKEHKINNVKVKDIDSTTLGKLAATASAWNAYNTKSTKVKPSVPEPRVSSEDLRTHLVNAGRAHQQNVSVALEIARGNLPPEDAFSSYTTPKTGPYGETQFQAEPHSLVHGDVRNVAAHIRDVRAGRVSNEQGMMLFSQEEGQPRHYMLNSRSPMPPDTWQVALGSGQSLWTRAKSKAGDYIGRGFSPAKRLVEKGFPLSPDTPGKEAMGITGRDPTVTGVGVIAAQHNEALRVASEDILGAMSFDQFGETIYTPAALLQPVTWTKGRRDANADEAFKLAEQKRSETLASQESAKRAAEEESERLKETQQTLF